MNPAEKKDIFEALDAVRREAERRRTALRERPIPEINICMATCDLAAGAYETKTAIEEAVADLKIDAHIKTVGCSGHCYAAPVVTVCNPGWPPVMYHGVNSQTAGRLVNDFLKNGDPFYEHILGSLEKNDLIPETMDFPRFSNEMRVVLDKCGHVDPEDLYDYIANGGWSAFIQALRLSPDEIVKLIADSGLRGRGGAGFDTGRKWALAADSPETEKYVICNADEGDPGAYMDRTILESNPQQVLEGIAVCAYAVGARKAIIYIRAEYPRAVKMVEKAIVQAREVGLFGGDNSGASPCFDISVFKGSGAFVCGEESALIRSMEGRRGEPGHRPPYPVEKGLMRKPTVINNVKTLASVPPIITKGSVWFRSIGTARSPGTAVFSVVGAVVHPGLVEIPMGVTLRTLIFDICGGVPRNKTFKAVQIGGPSGGCLSEEHLDIPVDFDSLKEAGAMLGSGGLVVMNEDACMVNTARHFLEFTQKESCGKCTFCRIGAYQILNILKRITGGEGRKDDLEVLEELCLDVQSGSLCGLGKTAPNPVLTSLKYFREEYVAHIEEKRCPACMCRALTAYYIDLDRCARGCEACIGCCPMDAIFTTSTRKKGIDQERCVKCGECVAFCPPEYKAVIKISPPELAPVIERPKDSK